MDYRDEARSPVISYITLNYGVQYVVWSGDYDIFID